MHGRQDNWNIRYHPTVVSKDIPSLDTSVSVRIRRSIEGRLMIDPVVYGLPLRGTLAGFYKIRIGDWRVVYRISMQEKTVFILIIAHRSFVYKRIHKRR